LWFHFLFCLFHFGNKDFLPNVRAHEDLLSCKGDILNIENPTPKKDMSIADLKMRLSELRAIVAAASSCGTRSIARPCREKPRAKMCEPTVAIAILSACVVFYSLARW